MALDPEDKKWILENNERMAAVIGATVGQRVAELSSVMERGFADVNARLDQTNARLDQTNARLDQTNSRLDQVIVNTGVHWRDHEDRIRRLEERAASNGQPPKK